MHVTLPGLQCYDGAPRSCVILEGTTGKEQSKGSDDKCPNDKGVISWKTGTSIESVFRSPGCPKKEVEQAAWHI